MKTLWLICDASGSMLEAGKRLIVRSLVRQVEQCIRLGYAPETDIKLVAWHTDATVILWAPEDEVPPHIFECRGSADGAALVQLFTGSLPGNMFVLFTDGFWSESSQIAIEQWKAGLDPNALRVIKIGVDANPKLVGSEVFESEAFFAAFEEWLAR